MIFSGIITNAIYAGKFFLNDFPWPFLFLRGFAEWLFIIGVYGVFREIFTKTYSWIPVFSELAMPFYLTHQQLLIALVAAASWVPILSNFALTKINFLKLSIFRVLPNNAYTGYNCHLGSVLDHHKVWTSQIFLWPTNST